MDRLPVISLNISSYTLLTNQDLAILVNMHASYLSLYVALSIFFSLNLLMDKKWQKTSTIALVFFSGFLFLLAARMVILSTVFSIFIWFILFQFNWKRLLVLTITCSIATIALLQIPSVKKRFAEVINSEKVEYGNSPEGEFPKNYGGRAIRAAIWDCSMPIVYNNWLWGVGAGDVHEHLQAAYKKKEFELAWKYNNYNSHNLFIETTIAVGIIGLLILILMFLLLFKKSAQKRDFMMLSFSILFLFFSTVEATFNVQRGIVFFILFSAIFLNQCKLHKDEYY